MKKEHSVKEFNCKSTTIYFIYSFLFSKINIKTDKKIVEEALKSGGYSPTPPSDKGNFEPYLKIREEYIEFDFFHGEAKILMKGGQQKNVVIEKNILFYRTGVGIHTIKVIIDRSLKIEELIEFSLIGDNETYKMKFGKTQEARSLFRLFRDDIKLISDKWNLLVGRKEDYSIWFESRENLVNPDEHYQNPFVYIELELPVEIYKEAFLESNEYQREIAAILFRLKVKEDWKYIDDSYLRKYEDAVDSKLVNMHLYSKLFVSFHTRSCIAACTNKNEQPAVYFLPALLDTVQLLRCRWHSYVVFNSYLDDRLRKLYGNFATGEFHVAQFLEDIISMREDLSSSLEDPITWKRASGSLGGIYEAGLKRFRIENLEKMMIEKMKMLDRLFGNVKEHRFRRKIAKIEEEQKSWKSKFLFFLAFAFVGLGCGLILWHKMLFNIPLTGLVPLAIGVAILVFLLKTEERFEEEKTEELQG